MSDLPSFAELPAKPGNPARSSWGLWGDDDELGCLNLLTAERTAAAAALVRTGQLFSMNAPLDWPSPSFAGPTGTRQAPDHVVLTSDNPRFEDPMRIINDVLAGMDGDGGSYEVVPDRVQAIEHAISEADPGDVVVIAGKGHEAYQLVRGDRLPFSDVRIAEAAIRKAGA